MAECDPDYLLRHMAVVLQNLELLAMTVRENVGYGSAALTEDDVQQACGLANAADFVQELDGQLSYAVGYRGQHLSGGQVRDKKTKQCATLEDSVAETGSANQPFLFLVSLL